MVHTSQVYMRNWARLYLSIQSSDYKVGKRQEDLANDHPQCVSLLSKTVLIALNTCYLTAFLGSSFTFPLEIPFDSLLCCISRFPKSHVFLFLGLLPHFQIEHIIQFYLLMD